MSIKIEKSIDSSIVMIESFGAYRSRPLIMTLFFFAAVMISAVSALGAESIAPSRARLGENRIVAHVGAGVSFNWFWVFYEKETFGRNKTMVFRPFYLKSGSEESFFQASLMPFLFWRYKNPEYDKWKWLFGFGQVDNISREKGRRDYDFGFFPFLFLGFGSDSAKDKYFLLWPIGGTMKKKFVTDSLTAFVFPGFLIFVFFPPASILSYTTLMYVILSMIPVYLSYEVNDFKAWDIAWPFFHYGKGGLREEFRILPFYTHFVKRGWYDKYSFLFVFNYQRFYFSNDLHQLFFFFPIFGRKWSRSGRISAVTVLWPFFSWGYDKRNGDWELNAPWPLIQFKDTVNPKIKKRIFFPVYGLYRYLDDETMFITPLYFRLKKLSYQFDSQEHFVLAVFWFYKRSYHHGPDAYYGREWRYFKMWPVFSIEYNDLGDRAFNLLSVLPFRDRQGYEMMYQPFWSIVEFVSFRNGEKRLGLLMRLFFCRWGGNFINWKVPFLLSVGRKENRLTELIFFEYMFGYTENRKGRYCRLFWIPIRLGDSQGYDAAATEEEGNTIHVASESYLMIDRRMNAVHATHHFGWKNEGSRSGFEDIFRITE